MPSDPSVSFLKNYYDKDYFESGKKSGYKNYSKGFNYYRNKIRDYQRAIHLVLNFKPKRVLDIGCAYGYVVMALRSFGVEAYGIDISEHAINNSPKKAKPFLKLTDITNIPFDNGYFDLVVSYDVLEHIPTDKLPIVLKEIKRVSSKNIYLEVFIDNKVNKIFKINDASHVSVYKKEFWDRFFKKNGFSLNKKLIFPGGLGLRYKSFNLRVNQMFYHE